MYTTTIIKNKVSDAFYLCYKLRLFHPWLREGFRVLVYHNIGRIKQDYLGLGVAPELFKEQMEYLYLNGYRVVPLKDLIVAIRDDRHICEWSVAITFDDGYSQNIDFILDTLNTYCFRATFFITASGLEGMRRDGGREGYWQGLELLNAEQVKKIVNSGNDIGSHFYSHRILTSLTPRELELEVNKSRDVLEGSLGVKINLFSYPHGKFSERVKEALKKFGCLGACCSIPGFNSRKTDIFSIRRISVDGWDTIYEFRKKLLGCYDWLEFFLKNRYYVRDSQ